MLQRRLTALSSVLILASAAAMAACSSGHQTQPASATTGTTGAVDTTGFAVPKWATSAAFVGPLAPATVLDVQVHLKMQNQDAAFAQFNDISNPDSANYGNFLTDDQFNALYAPSAANFAAVQAHLTGSGLTVTESPVNRAYVSVRGTVAQINAAFSTTVAQYSVNGLVKRAPMTALTLPATISPMVSAILGVAEPMTMKPAYKRASNARPETTPPGGGGSGAITAGTCTSYYGELVDTVDPAFAGGPNPLPYIGCPYTPPQVRAAYGFDVPVGQGIDGTGQTVAILDAFEAPTLLADAQKYAAAHDPSHPLKSSQFKEYTGPGTPPPASCETTQDAQGWYGEQGLDVEAVHAVAPGADIAFVGAVSDSDAAFLSAINMIITQHLASVVSNSWSGSEEGGGDFAAYEGLAVQAGLKGIGLYFASGDNGDTTLGAPAGTVPTVGFPSSLTEVTGVGGTSFEFDKAGGRAFETGWATGNSFLIPDGYDAGAWPPSYGGYGGSCSDDAGTDDGGAQYRLPGTPAGTTYAPDLHKDAGTVADAGTGSGGGSGGGSSGEIWWPSAPGGFGGGAGGGTSELYLQPSWQKGVVPNALATYNPYAGTPTSPARVVPDVGMLADPYTGYLVGETDPNSGTYSESGIGGTSLATPLFTASIALAQQYANRHFGSANALIYKAAKSGGLRDVTPLASLGAVVLPGTDQNGNYDPQYDSLATFSYTGPENILTCTTGFDDETGLGAPNGTQFLDAMKQH